MNESNQPVAKVQGRVSGISPDTLQLIEIPPAKLDNFTAGFSHELMDDAYNAVAVVAMAAAWKAGYLQVRSNGGKHDEAVKLANKCLVGLRKSLRYSYPESGAINV